MTRREIFILLFAAPIVAALPMPAPMPAVVAPEIVSFTYVSIDELTRLGKVCDAVMDGLRRMDDITFSGYFDDRVWQLGANPKARFEA